jgi:hypothetical protein
VVGWGWWRDRVPAYDLERPNLPPVGAEGGPRTQQELDAKLDSLAAVVNAQQPDVLALQEVGEPQQLAALQQRCPTLGHSPLSSQPDGRGIRVAYLSRLSLQSPVPIHAFPAGLAPVQVGDPPAGGGPPPTLSTMGRGALQATVDADGHQVSGGQLHPRRHLAA